MKFFLREKQPKNATSHPSLVLKAELSRGWDRGLQDVTSSWFESRPFRHYKNDEVGVMRKWEHQTWMDQFISTIWRNVKLQLTIGIMPHGFHFNQTF